MPVLWKSNAITPSSVESEVVKRNPRHIWIEPTNRCNTRCRHCGHFYSNFGEDMEAELYRKIADQVLDGVERAELIGYGEPFMGKHFWTMFDECVARDIEIFSTTNGILLRKDEPVRKIVRNRVTLCLSIDGARKETFEHVRPYIKWHKLLETLECLKRNADEAGPECKYQLRFNFCAMKLNIGDLPDLVLLAAKYGASEIFVLPLGGEELFTEVTGQSLHASPELVSDAYMKALPLAVKHGIMLQVPESFRELLRRGTNGTGMSRLKYYTRSVKLRRYLWQMKPPSWENYQKRKDVPVAKAGSSYCTMPWKDSYFASNGTVYPCCIQTEKLGDMTKQSWEEIWNGQVYRNLRRTVHSWNPSKVCRFCPLPTGINGGDDKSYTKFFEKLRCEPVALDSPSLRIGEGFHKLELMPDRTPSHYWMAKKGEFSIPRAGGAKFLRLRTNPRCLSEIVNPGTCSINGGPPEPFDDSCDEINIPIEHIEDAELLVTLEMENTNSAKGDDRELSIPIKGIELLF